MRAATSDAAEHLLVTLRRTTFDDPDTPGFDGPPSPRRSDTQHAEELIVGCDFELTVHLVVAMRAEVPFQVHELDDPPRPAIDIGPDIG